MTNITSLSDRHRSSDETAADALIEDSTGIGDRFLTGFQQFLADKKRQAILDVLKEDMPSLAENEDLIRRISQKLADDQVLKEKRFVFLVCNPKYKF